MAWDLMATDSRSEPVVAASPYGAVFPYHAAVTWTPAYRPRVTPQEGRQPRDYRQIMSR